jgi:hypothetical protein
MVRGQISNVETFTVCCLSEDCEETHTQSYLPRHEFAYVITQRGWRYKEFMGWYCPECDAA